MENAADALKMAAAILIFIIAIASSFSLFGTAKQTADSIIGMRDKQAYLEISSDEVGGILYTSSEDIADGEVSKVTTIGDRIVDVSDIISTIYRYSKENYGVTIIEKTGLKSGKVIARFDSSTEGIMNQWYNITENQLKEDIADTIKSNISTKYIDKDNIELDLETLYKIKISGNNNIKCGAPWYANDTQIKKRINCELEGRKYSYNNQVYEKNSLNNILKNANERIEVTNEIDESKYLDNKLLQQYEPPIVEIVYIIID